MDIAGIEDALVSAVQGAQAFRAVLPVLRGKRPPALIFPAAFIWLDSAIPRQARSRPMIDMTYGISVVTKNVLSEDAASKDVYQLILAVYSAVQGKFFGRPDIEPFELASVEFADFEAGEISYELKFKTGHSQIVPKME